MSQRSRCLCTLLTVHALIAPLWEMVGGPLGIQGPGEEPAPMPHRVAGLPRCPPGYHCDTGLDDAGCKNHAIVKKRRHLAWSMHPASLVPPQLISMRYH